MAVCDRGNYPVLQFHGEDGSTLDHVPTLVASPISNTRASANAIELRYGLDALAVIDDPGFVVVRSFKRLLGDAGAAERVVEIGSARVPLFELVHGFLVHLRSAIVERSNLSKAKKKDKELHAVVATPANALGAQRFVTLDAFRRAGFSVVATLNEPSAAGFEYTHAHRGTVTSKREHVVVYDLGGGTFDASLVRVTDLKHDAVLTSGVARLGGDDFDEVLLELVTRDLPPRDLDVRTRARLLDQCRDAKERLNPNSKKLTIDLEPVLGDGQITLSTADYYAACTPLVERTIDAMLPVITRAEQGENGLVTAMDEAVDEALAEIAGIYVVGGASALPIVSRVLRERFGRRVHRSPYPSAATAVGLAIAADDDAGYEIADRFSRAFGVFRESAAGKDVRFDVVFDRETELPKKGEPARIAERRYRVAHDLGHYRFVECTGVDRNGAPQGDVSLFAEVRFPFVSALQDGRDLADVPVRRLGALGTTIRERYAIDEHGLVSLSVTDETSGYTRDFTLGR